MKLTEKCYRPDMRPTLLDGSEYWAVKKSKEQRMKGAEMSILRYEWSLPEEYDDKGVDHEAPRGGLF